MKRTHLILFSAALAIAITSATSNTASAQGVDVARTQTWDVLELKDGSIYKGVIVEQTPGQSYKLALSDGSIRVFLADQIVKISKEANPNVAAPVAAPVAGTSVADPSAPAWRGEHGGRPEREPKKPLPVPFAQSGMRFGLDAIVAFPTGDLSDFEVAKTSFAPGLRFGYEAINGNLGLGGGIQARFVPWILTSELKDADYSAWLLEAQAYGRLSFHVGKFAPYAGLSLGVNSAHENGPGNDDDVSETGFGMDIDFGFDAFVSDSIALGLGGSVVVVAPEMPSNDGHKYFGLRLGMTTHF